MVCATDWLRTLARASFRGALFYVETDKIKYGRRIKTHEFPNRDRPFQEDLGEKAIDLRATAYVASDAALSEKDALVSACRQRGSGTLVLPAEGSMRVVCFSCERSFSKDKLGYIAFDLHFGEAGLGFGIGPLAMLQNLVAVQGGVAIGVIGLHFSASFNVVGEASWVVQAAIDTARGWIAHIDGVRTATRMRRVDPTGLSTQARSEIVDGSTFALSLSHLYDAAPDHVHGGAGVKFPYSYGGPQPSAVPVAPTLPGKVADLLGEMRLAIERPEDAFEALREVVEFDINTFPEKWPLAGGATAPYPVGIPGAGGGGVVGGGGGAVLDGGVVSRLTQASAMTEFAEELSESAAAQKRNEAEIGRLFRRTALVEMSIAAVEAEYPDRRSAIRARATLSELWERELRVAAGMTFQEMDALRGKAISALSSSIADMRPIVVVEGNASLPSLVWAHRLYGDARRGSDLRMRNRVRHPAFMPPSFEAESS
jgi:hypothetical protein